MACLLCFLFVMFQSKVGGWFAMYQSEVKWFVVYQSEGRWLVCYVPH